MPIQKHKAWDPELGDIDQIHDVRLLSELISDVGKGIRSLLHEGEQILIVLITDMASKDDLYIPIQPLELGIGLFQLLGILCAVGKPIGCVVDQVKARSLHSIRKECRPGWNNFIDP